MKHKITIWSGGSKNARITKINTVGYGVCFVLLCILHITTFIWTPYDNNGIPVTIIEHVIFGMMFVCTLGWITALMLFRFIDSFRNIKNNKLIHLYLYDLVNFAKIGEIPEDKFILSSNKNRIVLAEKQYEKESKAFLDNILYYDFDSYCKKHSVSTEEIEL